MDAMMVDGCLYLEEYKSPQKRKKVMDSTLRLQSYYGYASSSFLAAIHQISTSADTRVGYVSYACYTFIAMHSRATAQARIRIRHSQPLLKNAGQATSIQMFSGVPLYVQHLEMYL